MNYLSAINNMVSRAIVDLKNGAYKMRTLQTLHLGGEVREDVEHFEPYGYTSEPHRGAEAITLSLSGDKDHTVAVVVADRRYRLTALEDGEVAIYDDLGKHVWLKRDGISVDSAGTPVTVKATTVTLDAKEVFCSGNFTAAGNVSDKGGKYTMDGMRSTYNSHTHVHGGSSSNAPTQKM